MIGLDIETDTTVNGLDPRVAPIVAVALVDGDTTFVFDDPDERALLAAVDATVASLAASGPGVLVTWNGSGFDLPFIAARAAALGLPVGLQTVYDPTLAGRHEPLPGHRGRVRASWHGHRHLDGYQAYRADVGQVLPVSCGLKSLARFVGLPVIEVDRAAIHELSERERRDYVASDAFLARALVARRADATRWIDQLPEASGS